MMEVIVLFSTAARGLIYYWYCMREHLDGVAGLAQSVERQALNLVVVGSSPTAGVILL